MATQQKSVTLPIIRDEKLRRLAFTHRSAVNEYKEIEESNERLEYLGDAVLELITTEYLFHTYPAKSEGELTMIRSALVNTVSLAQFAVQCDIGKHLLLSKGEDKAGGRQNQAILADSMEAYLGALYLDQKLDCVRTFLTHTLLTKAEEILKNKQEKDSKSRLQEIVQQRKWGTPEYAILEEIGPEHNKEFLVEVTYGDTQQFSTRGKGKTKQQAQQQAAKFALENLSEE